MKSYRRTLVSFALCLTTLSACSGDDDDSSAPPLTDAQRHGVGAACDAAADCYVGTTMLECLPFKGGYCGLEGCATSDDCPAGSGCVTHDDGKNYCFLLCVEKADCNATRPVDIEANCVSSVDFADGTKNTKACVPPS